MAGGMAPGRTSRREALRAALGPELRATVTLAVPVVAAQLSMMAMGVVDTIMVGRLGATALGAVSLGNTLAFSVSCIFFGAVLGAEPLIGNAFGARRMGRCGEVLVQALWLAVVLGIPLTVLLYDAEWLLRLLGQPEDVVREGARYLTPRALATIPFLAFAALRTLYTSVGSPRAVLAIAVAANIVNALANYVLIWGMGPIPAMGVMGAGYATFASQVAMTALALGLLPLARYQGFALRVRAPDLALQREILWIGLPLGVQLLAEVGAFSAMTILAGWLGEVPLAAHQVALTLVSTTFMVPLGIAGAGGVRVAQLLGEGNPQRAARAGRIALGLGVCFQVVSALAFLSFPELFMRIFTNDDRVVALGAVLVQVGGVFQISDGLQVVAAGCLRGARDTRVSMVANLAGHWLIGLPLGYVLAFPLGLGAQGLWIGATLALTVVGAWLTARFLRGSWLAHALVPPPAAEAAVAA